MFLSEGWHFYVDMHFYAAFFACQGQKNGRFYVIMHFYAIFFTYVDLNEQRRSVHFYVIFILRAYFTERCCTYII